MPMRDVQRVLINEGLALLNAREFEAGLGKLDEARRLDDPRNVSFASRAQVLARLSALEGACSVRTSGEASSVEPEENSARLFQVLGKLSDELQRAVLNPPSDRHRLAYLIESQTSYLAAGARTTIASLPVELLRIIFRLVVLSARTPSSERAFDLSGVCRTWKAVAKSDGTLWGDVMFATKGWPGLPCTLSMKAAALGARGPARRVWIHGTDREVSKAVAWLSQGGRGHKIEDLRAVMGQETLESVWAVLKAPTSALTNLHLEASNGIDLVIPAYTFSSLHTLELCDIALSPTGAILALISTMPVLEVLRLSGVDGCVFDAGVTDPGAQIDVGSSFPTLKTLSLCYLSAPGSDAASLYPLLSRARGLQTIEIRSCENLHLVRPGDDSNVLSWPTLTSLTLDGNRWTDDDGWRLGSDIPFDIIAPRLESLTITNDRRASYRPLLFRPFGGTNVANLQDLTLHQSAAIDRQTTAGFLDDLSRMVELKTLILVQAMTSGNDRENERALFRGLTLEAGPGPHRCPKMNMLVVAFGSEGVLEVRALLDMVVSRRDRAANGVEKVGEIWIAMTGEAKAHNEVELGSLGEMTEVGDLGEAFLVDR